MTTIVADAGPLLALAKVDALTLLYQLYDDIWITSFVFSETVEAGQRIGALDATVIASAVDAGWLQVQAQTDFTLPVPGLLGAGELSSLALALANKIDWLLIDDADARRLAEANILAAGVATQVKGTLGVIVSAFQAQVIDSMQAITLIEAIKSRPDIWISAKLCDKVTALLR